jgi:wyosine [tRNA(Phe)-imidazoG37] synthetase (radical SAM superfamily)
MQVESRMFYNPQKILRNVRDKVKKVKETGDPIDCLTFVPDGEPTLDINLASEIDLLKSLGIKIAVITNGSLIWRHDVRETLMKADWVSLKIDSAQEEIWRRINRPYGTLKLSLIQQGMFKFARTYRGKLVTETMLVKTVNDSKDSLSNIADLLARLRPDRAYLSIPTRPPAEKWVQPPPEEIINQAYHILHERINQVEYLIGYEGNDFAFTGNVEEDLLSITAVHPMREEAVSDFLTRAGADWSVIQRLIDRGQLIEMKYKGRKFYMRRLPERYTE